MENKCRIFLVMPSIWLETSSAGPRPHVYMHHSASPQLREDPWIQDLTFRHSLVARPWRLAMFHWGVVAGFPTTPRVLTPRGRTDNRLPQPGTSDPFRVLCRLVALRVMNTIYLHPPVVELEWLDCSCIRRASVDLTSFPCFSNEFVYRTAPWASCKMQTCFRPDQEVLFLQNPSDGHIRCFIGYTRASSGVWVIHMTLHVFYLRNLDFGTISGPSLFWCLFLPSSVSDLYHTAATTEVRHAPTGERGTSRNKHLPHDF